MSETAAAFAVSWWMVRAAQTEACVLTLPDVDVLSPRMLSIDEHRFRRCCISSQPGGQIVDPARATTGKVEADNTGIKHIK